MILICGGRDKHIDFSVLRELVQKKVKKMIAIGEDMHTLRSAALRKAAAGETTLDEVLAVTTAS